MKPSSYFLRFKKKPKAMVLAGACLTHSCKTRVTGERNVFILRFATEIARCTFTNRPDSRKSDAAKAIIADATGSLTTL